MKIDKTMKRWVFILIAALAIFLTADLCARERGVKFSGGTDLVSTYGRCVAQRNALLKESWCCREMLGAWNDSCLLYTSDAADE